MIPKTCLLINFHDAHAPMEKPQNWGSAPPREIALIGRMNQHPRPLSLLGILPNQFRTLLKETAFENREEAISDLSRTLFFAGFSIWNKRQKLSSRFWNDISPKNRKKHKKKQKKKYQIEAELVSSNCKNPFHFLKRNIMRRIRCFLFQCKQNRASPSY